MSAPSPRECEVLVRSGMRMAEGYAEQFERTWPRLSQRFASVGYEALVVAANAYDPSLGPFSAFARKRVVGAMHDFVLAECREADQQVLAARNASLLGIGTDKLPKLDLSAYDEGPAETRARAAREKRLRVQRMAAAALMVGDKPIDPEEMMLDREESQRAVAVMNQVLAGLSADQRDVFRLHGIQGKQQAEVGRLLNLSIRSVQRYLAEFEQRMKAGLVEAGIELGPNVERAWFHFVKLVGEGDG